MYYICVPILLYTFPHTAMYVFSYYYMGSMVSLPLEVAQHHVCHAAQPTTTTCVLTLLYMCPQVTNMTAVTVLNLARSASMLTYADVC